MKFHFLDSPRGVIFLVKMSFITTLIHLWSKTEWEGVRLVEEFVPIRLCNVGQMIITWHWCRSVRKCNRVFIRAFLRVYICVERCLLSCNQRYQQNYELPGDFSLICGLNRTRSCKLLQKRADKHVDSTQNCRKKLVLHCGFSKITRAIEGR